MRQHFSPEFNFDNEELCNNLRSPFERSQPHTGVSELRSGSHPASKWNVISWCVVSIYQWFRWNKPFTKRLFTSLSVCMHKGFDLQWNGVATQKATNAVIYRLTPLRLLWWQLIIHNHRFVWVMEWTCLSVSVCLSVCLPRLSLMYLCLTHTFSPAHSFLITTATITTAATGLILFFYFFEKGERLPCCQADVGEAGEGGRVVGNKGEREENCKSGWWIKRKDRERGIKETEWESPEGWSEWLAWKTNWGRKRGLSGGNLMFSAPGVCFS